MKERLLNLLVQLIALLAVIASAEETVCFDNEYLVNGTCVACPGGMQPNTEKTECVECPAGYYSTNNSPCLKCMPGTYSKTGWNRCIQCSDGTFADEFGQTECMACEAPMISNQHHTVCAHCPNGTVYVGYVGQVVPCMLCPPNSVSVDNNTRCVECGDKEVPYHNVCMRLCDDEVQHNCLKSVCEDDEYYDEGMCKTCENGFICENGIRTDCSHLSVVCQNNKKKSCTPFVETPNFEHSDCDISLSFLSILIVSCTFLIALLLIAVVFVVTRLVVQRKTFDFSQNNAQETDPTKVYLLSF